jgi:hypothetical protein
MKIPKNILQSIISKYYLGGLIESVKWSINQDKQLIINFISPSGEMIGNVTCNDFDIESTDIGISNTSQLIKLLQVTNEELELNFVKQNKIYTKLNISDKQFNVSYTLADLMIIPKPATIGDVDFIIEFPLIVNDINALIKAKNALPDSETVVISHDILNGNKIKLEFGGDIEYANKILYNIDMSDDNLNMDFDINSLYNSNIIKEILSNNKDTDYATMALNPEGIMRLSFHKENITSIYFLVAKEK